MTTPATSSTPISIQSRERGRPKDSPAYWIILAIFAATGALLIIAPVLAISWIDRPFPGFTIEQTHVVTGNDGDRWAGRLAGLNYPQQIMAINGQPVSTLGEWHRLVSQLVDGGFIRVHTRLPDGTQGEAGPIQVQRFPPTDLARLFWLPYGVGLAYLLIGWWVFRARGDHWPGRAFAYFCITAAIANLLMFDLTTTHALSEVWTVAVAQIGGAAISLALLFPEEWSLVPRHPWMRLLPYIPSIGLGAWGLRVLRDEAHPWAYVIAWRASYAYAALGILTFAVIMLYRYFKTGSAGTRQQVRIILGGSLISFLPIGVWLGAPLFGVMVAWNPGLFLPWLLIFPVSIAVAILRYRLFDIDFLLNRTIVYGSLTAILASIYAGGIMVFEWLLRNLTGEESPLAIAFSTLVIAVLFNPLRLRIQNFIDRRFYRRKYNASQVLAAFGSQVRDETALDQLGLRISEVLENTLGPETLDIWLYERTSSNGTARLFNSIHPSPHLIEIASTDALATFLQKHASTVLLENLDLTSPLLEQLRANDVQLLMPLVSHSELLGLVSLGKRLSDQNYSIDDFHLLDMLAAQASPSIRVAYLIRQQQAELLQKERIENELHIARLIQQTLVPIHPPEIRGWIIESHYQPAREVGGDFYDFIRFQDGQLGLMIGDVTDKGIPAALVMASTRSSLRSTAYQRLSPGEVLKQTNQIVCQEIPEGMFVTCLYAVLDPATGVMRYANAGHNLPYVRSDAGVTELYATGMPLGLMPEMEYEEKEITLQPGDCLLLYSDGLVEAHNPSWEMFDDWRLSAFIAGQKPAGPGLVQCVLDELHNFTGPDWEQEDDVTLLALHRAND